MISPGPHRTPGKRTRNRFGKNPPRCVVWGDRIDLLSAYQLQSLTTAAGASPHNPYPIAKIMTVNHPRGIFSRRRGIAHGGVGADGLPHKMYPVHQSNPNQVAKSLKNGLLLIWTVSHFGLYRPHFSRAASSSGARFAFSSSVTPSVHASIACMVATAPSRVPFGWPWIPPLTRRTSSVP